MEDWRIAQFYDRVQSLRFASGETRKLRDLFLEFLWYSLPEEMREERAAADPTNRLPLNPPPSPTAAVMYTSERVQIKSGAPVHGGVGHPQLQGHAVMQGNAMLSGVHKTRTGQTVQVTPAPGSAAHQIGRASCRERV